MNKTSIPIHKLAHSNISPLEFATHKSSTTNTLQPLIQYFDLTDSTDTDDALFLRCPYVLVEVKYTSTEGQVSVPGAFWFLNPCLPHDFPEFIVMPLPEV